MDGATRAAEDYADYRFFRFVAVWSARFTIAALFFLVWWLLFFRGPEYGSTLIFLGSTGGLSLLISLVSAMVSYTLYKRRGGRIEKTPPPVPQ